MAEANKNHMRLNHYKGMRQIAFSVALAMVAGVMVGCGNPTTDAPPAAPVGRVTVEEPKIMADAGIALADPSAGLTPLLELAKTKNFGSRPDPFALLALEAAFNKQQQAERFLSDFGGFSTMFEEPDPVEDDAPVLQPRPAWRLAGIVIADGVVALLDLGNGQVVEVRPGQRVLDSEWVVVSIDTERAVLRRPGNQLPREIIVNLEGPLGIGGGGGGGGGRGGGGPQGGDGAGGGGRAPDLGDGAGV